MTRTERMANMLADLADVAALPGIARIVAGSMVKADYPLSDGELELALEARHAVSEPGYLNEIGPREVVDYRAAASLLLSNGAP